VMFFSASVSHSKLPSLPHSVFYLQRLQVQRLRSRRHMTILLGTALFPWVTDCRKYSAVWTIYIKGWALSPQSCSD